ncbi:MAG: protein kinase [Planctomycetaceae bacterium]|nr:protein kinase [Planctomycetaceae bacterium]
MNRPTSGAGKVERSGKSRSATTIWSTQAITLSRMEKPDTGAHFLVKRVSGSQIPGDLDLQQAAARIQAIGRQDFPGILKIGSVKFTGNDLGVALPIPKDGKPLSEWISSGKSGQEAMESLQKLARNLDELHGKSIVHGDIHPETIVLASEEASLLDFAVCHVVQNWTASQRTVDTKVSSPIVPANYLAPELHLGFEASPASDQYAFALSCLECLVGQRLEDGESVDGLIRKLPKLLSQSLSGVFRKALNPEPTERFPTCQEFSDQIAAAPTQRSAGQRKLKFQWLTIAALVPLIVLPVGKWFWAQVAAYRLSFHSAQLKQEALDEVIGAYAVSVSKPRSTSFDDRLPSLSNLASASMIEDWRQQARVRQAEEAAEMLAEDFDGIRKSLERNLQRQIRLSRQGAGKQVFSFSRVGGLLGSGTPDTDVLIQWRGIPSATAKVPLIETKWVMTPSRGAPSEKVFTIRRDSPSSFSWPVAAPEQGWSDVDKVTFAIQIQDPQSKKWSDIRSEALTEIQFGTVDWIKHPPVIVTASKAIETRNEIRSGITVDAGTKYQFTTSGKIAPWKESLHKQFQTTGAVPFGFEGPIGIPPEGVSVRAVNAAARSYHAVDQSTGQSHWGALLMRIGRNSFGWEVPATIRGPRTATVAGEFIFGLNLPNELRAGKDTKSLFGETEYWKDQGQFEIAFETREIKFPPGTPTSVQSEVRLKF